MGNKSELQEASSKIKEAVVKLESAVWLFTHWQMDPPEWLQNEVNDISDKLVTLKRKVDREYEKAEW